MPGFAINKPVIFADNLKEKFNVEGEVMAKIDYSKVINFIQTKWHNKMCPMCQNSNWSVSDQVFEMREFNGGNLVISGDSSIIPVIPITCSNCGNIIFVNAILAGLVKNNGVSR